MRRSAALLLLAAVLTACKPDVAVPEAPLDRPVREPSLAVRDLAGHWRVAAIDGRAVDQPVALALTGDGQRLWWEPRCAGMARNYAIRGASIRFTSTQPRRAPGAPTPPVCAIGLPPRLGELFRALDLADRVARSPNNGIVIAGPGHSLTLFSQ